MAEVVAEPKTSSKLGGWIAFLLFIAGLTAVAFVIYERAPDQAKPELITPPAENPTKAIKVVKTDLQACTDLNVDLQAEVTRLKKLLDQSKAPLIEPTTSPKKRVVEVLRKTQPAPAKDANVPQSPPWNSTRVPEPVVKWLQQ